MMNSKDIVGNHVILDVTALVDYMVYLDSAYKAGACFLELYPMLKERVRWDDFAEATWGEAVRGCGKLLSIAAFMGTSVMSTAIDLHKAVMCNPREFCEEFANLEKLPEYSSPIKSYWVVSSELAAALQFQGESVEFIEEMNLWVWGRINSGYDMSSDAVMRAVAYSNMRDA